MTARQQSKLHRNQVAIRGLQTPAPPNQVHCGIQAAQIGAEQLRETRIDKQPDGLFIPP